MKVAPRCFKLMKSNIVARMVVRCADCPMNHAGRVCKAFPESVTGFDRPIPTTGAAFPVLCPLPAWPGSRGPKQPESAQQVSERPPVDVQEARIAAMRSEYGDLRKTMQIRQEIRNVIDGTCAMAEELGVGRTSIWRVAHGHRKSARIEAALIERGIKPVPFRGPKTRKYTRKVKTSEAGSPQ